MPYAPDSGLGAGLGAGLAFLGGLDMPMLMRKNLSPLRSESITLMVLFPFPYPGTACGPGNGRKLSALPGRLPSSTECLPAPAQGVVRAGCPVRPAAAACRH